MGYERCTFVSLVDAYLCIVCSFFNQYAVPIIALSRNSKTLARHARTNNNPSIYHTSGTNLLTHLLHVPLAGSFTDNLYRNAVIIEVFEEIAQICR